MDQPPLRVAIIPVTPFQQNCTLVWCTRTMRGAVVDAGGDLPKVRAAIAQRGVAVEKLIVTHGHLDHCGGVAELAAELGVQIEGPHEADRFWIARLADDSRGFGIPGTPFEPDRWLDEDDEVTVGELVFGVRHCPGHTPGHVILHHRPTRFALVGDVLFKGSVGRTDFPMSSHDDLIASITDKLWPLGDETRFLPGHGPMSSFAAERATNPFVGDRALASA